MQSTNPIDLEQPKYNNTKVVCGEKNIFTLFWDVTWSQNSDNWSEVILTEQRQSK